MKIAMIASEANPFIKTGGLADVSYALSKELVKSGQEVALFIPFYKKVRDKLIKDVKNVGRVEVEMSWRKNSANIYEYTKDGIKYYFIENGQYYERDNVYGYSDDGERFAFFVLAVYKALPALKFKPDIIHVHDWQSAFFPCYAKEMNNPFYKDVKYVLTIHNPAFQGLLEKEALGDLFNLPIELYYSGKTRLRDMVSTLKSGIMYSDKIVAVSPTHRGELLTNAGGMGLGPVLLLREWDFTGYLNGIDYDEFNPLKDPYLKTPYDEKNFFTVKGQYKKELIDKYNLKIDGKPLFSMVSRLTWQKGMDILLPVIDDLAKNGCGIFILGSGESKYEYAIQALRDKYPSQIAVYVGYSNEIAHQVYAASDIFLMPSLFEPCGLGQMIAERYGTPPLVRRCGGLKDSVICYDGSNEDIANGFGFDDYTYPALRDTAFWALSTYENKQTFKKLMKNALKTDNTWGKSAEQYLNLYKSLLAK